MNFNFTINAKTFADALSQELRVVPNKSTILILENFKIELTDGVLRVTASNIDSAVTIAVKPTTAEGEGGICINARRFTDTIKKLDGDVYVAVNDNEVTLKTRTGNYQLQGLDAKEFPQTEPITDATLTATFATESLIGGLDATIYAVGTDDYRPTMKGVYMDFTAAGDAAPQRVVFAATDTHKLAKHEATAAFTTADPKGYILPLMAANIVRTMFAKEPNVKVCFNGNRAEFSNDTVRFSTTLITGRFPDYNRVIPQKSAIRVSIDRNELRNAINRVYGFADNNSLIAMRFGLGGVDIEAKDNTIMQNASERVDCDCDTEIAIGFSAEYLLGILANIDSEKVAIAMNDASRSAVFTPDVENATTLALLMPMSLN